LFSSTLAVVAKDQRLVFGEVAELYDRARPSYPFAIVDHLAGLIGEKGGPVLDIGCGTGKATVLLASRGLGGVGVEPDPDMAAVARRNLSPFPRWSVTVADFEQYGRDQSSAFELLTCAQAWHWLDPGRRFQQAGRLVRPGGWLALFWNRTVDDPSPVRRAIDAVYAELCPAASPHGLLSAGHPPVGTPSPEAGFGPSAWHVFPWVRRYTTTEWTDLAQTHSDHRRLDPRQRQVLLDRLGDVIDSHGGVYDNPFQCWLWTAPRLA